MLLLRSENGPRVVGNVRDNANAISARLATFQQWFPRSVTALSSDDSTTKEDLAEIENGAFSKPDLLALRRAVSRMISSTPDRSRRLQLLNETSAELAGFAVALRSLDRTELLLNEYRRDPFEEIDWSRTVISISHPFSVVVARSLGGASETRLQAGTIVYDRLDGIHSIQLSRLQLAIVESLRATATLDAVVARISMLLPKNHDVPSHDVRTIVLRELAVLYDERVIIVCNQKTEAEPCH